MAQTERIGVYRGRLDLALCPPLGDRGVVGSKLEPGESTREGEASFSGRARQSAWVTPREETMLWQKARQPGSLLTSRSSSLQHILSRNMASVSLKLGRALGGVGPKEDWLLCGDETWERRPVACWCRPPCCPPKDEGKDEENEL